MKKDSLPSVHGDLVFQLFHIIKLRSKSRSGEGQVRVRKVRVSVRTPA